MEHVRTKYVVFKANIMDDDGNKVLAGETVALSPALARHYNKLGFLRPVIEDGPEEEMEEDDEPPPVAFRTQRLTPQQDNAGVSAGTPPKPL